MKKAKLPISLIGTKEFPFCRWYSVSWITFIRIHNVSFYISDARRLVLHHFVFTLKVSRSFKVSQDQLVTLYIHTQRTNTMKFCKVFIFVALILAVFVGQGEAGWLKKIGKKIVSSISIRNIFTYSSNIELILMICVVSFPGTCWSTYPWCHNSSYRSGSTGRQCRCNIEGLISDWKLYNLLSIVQCTRSNNVHTLHFR